MKELSIEEKAKAYDEAINRASGFKSQEIRDIVEHIFPELRENEDEKIRKNCIHFLKLQKQHHAATFEIEECISWLEKQGEHQNFRDSIQIGDKVTRNRSGELVNLSQLNRVAKLADNVEPKFKVGDWIIKNDDSPIHIDYSCCKITKVENGNYTIESIYGYKGYNTFETFEKDYHLWTIQDAKDGDVLASEDKDKVFLYNGKLDLRGRVCAYCGIYKTYDGLRFTKCAIGNHFTYKEPYPATKEQRDTLFEKLKEAGCEWDAKKKKLKKIEQKPVKWSYNEDGQKQDVSIQINPSEYINDMGGNGCYLKNTAQASAWSEEDEMIALSIEQVMNCASLLNIVPEKIDKIKTWLKPLKERVQSQPKQEWSEEDEKMLDYALDMIEWYGGKNEDKSRLVSNWLKSLRPQNTWKPSDEQMNFLEELIEDSNQRYFYTILKSLYEQLKNLRDG